MKNLNWVIVPFLLLAMQSGAKAQPAKAASVADAQAVQWASSCMTCHGTDGKVQGVGVQIDTTSAAGIQARLLSFKAGSLPSTIMGQLMKGYSEDEIKRIALQLAQSK
jgi:cytochrome subunit of sulfide dehydrogenase